jgi:hypothetical protein
MPLEILVPPLDLICSEYLRLTDMEVEIMIDGRFPIDGSNHGLTFIYQQI